MKKVLLIVCLTFSLSAISGPMEGEPPLPNCPVFCNSSVLPKE